MTRLIDADKFKDSMKYVCDAGGWLEPVTKAVTEYVKKQIDAQPTVEAQPVRHGKWINFEHGDDKYYCDKCQTIWESKQIKNMHYCPTCGAKMDGELNEGL